MSLQVLCTLQTPYLDYYLARLCDIVRSVLTRCESETFGYSRGLRFRNSCLLCPVGNPASAHLSHFPTTLEQNTHGHSIGPGLGTEISQYQIWVVKDTRLQQIKSEAQHNTTQSRDFPACHKADVAPTSSTPRLQICHHPKTRGFSLLLFLSYTHTLKMQLEHNCINENIPEALIVV